MVEEGERLAGDVGFEPEGNFAQLDGERIEVHAVDAVADDVAHGFAEGGGAGLVVAGAEDGERGTDAPGGGKEDVAGAAGHVADFEREEGALFLRDGGLFQRVGDEVVERVLEERLDEFLRRVVGAGAGAFVAGGEGEVQPAQRGDDLRLVFEEALIDGAEFFDIEVLVVGADELAGVAVAEDGEIAQAAEKRGVVERGFAQWAEGLGVKEVAAEGFDAERVADAGFIEESEGAAERGPAVGVAQVGEVALFREPAKSGEAVVCVVEGALFGIAADGEDEVALLDDHEEEEPIDEAEELGVKLGGEIGRGGEGAQGVVGGVIEEAVGEVEDGGFDRAAEAVADARAGFESVLVVAFEERVGGGLGRLRQARDVEQSVEDREVGEEFLAKDAVEIEFDVGELHQPRGVAQEAEQAAIGDERVEVLGEVEVFLDVRVRADALAAPLGLAVERFPRADDVDRKAAVAAEAMGETKRLVADHLSLRVVFEFRVAEQTEQSFDKVARLGDAGFRGARRFEPVAVHPPRILRVSPRAEDVLFQTNGGIEAEIAVALAGKVRRVEPGEQFAGEDGAFDADAGEAHSCTPIG